jgi:hypothetical protein
MRSRPRLVARPSDPGSVPAAALVAVVLRVAQGELGATRPAHDRRLGQHPLRDTDLRPHSHITGGVGLLAFPPPLISINRNSCSTRPSCSIVAA